MVSLGIALLVSDITIIFDLIGAITSAFSIFFFPAAGYFAATKRFGSEATSRQYKWAAWLFLILGTAIVALSIY